MARIQLKSVIAFYSLILSFWLTGAAHATSIPSGAVNKNAVEINIGIYAPFTNKRAFIGRNILGAMEMAHDKLSSSQIHYSFFTLDRLADNQDSASTLQKFVTTHHINVLVTEGSVNGGSLAAFAKKNNLIHFSMASDPAIADGKNNFLIWSPAYEQAEVLVNTLKQKKVKQLGIITTNHPSDSVLTQSVMKQLQADSSIKIATYEQYDAGTKDFSGLINKIKGKNPDLYFIMASPEDIELIQSNMKQAHIDKPVTSIVERVTPKVMKVFNGQWYIDTHEMKPEFINQYLEENMNYPVTEAGYAYDLFNMLNQSVIMAMKAKSGFSTQELAEQIHTLATGTGVMGPFNLDKNGVLYTKSEVKTVNKGQIHTA
ncbi:ABC transporter substrate-binding protein [Legionella fallonii]|nr:ABC transporter substrate-binding protein [Legionella fallonii]